MSYCVILYHIISYQIIPHHIISYHIILYHIVLYHFISCHVIDCFIILHQIIRKLITQCHTMIQTTEYISLLSNFLFLSFFHSLSLSPPLFLTLSLPHSLSLSHFKSPTLSLSLARPLNPFLPHSLFPPLSLFFFAFLLRSDHSLSQLLLGCCSYSRSALGSYGGGRAIPLRSVTY